MTLNLLKPTLYSVGDSAHVVLSGRQCRCGHVFYPPQDFGCEKCGSFGTSIKSRDLGASGRLISWATVHMHAASYPKAPFVVGKIALDDGPFVRALIKVDSEKELVAQSRVTGVLVPTHDDAGHFDLWFSPVAERGAANV